MQLREAGPSAAIPAVGSTGTEDATYVIRAYACPIVEQILMVTGAETDSDLAYLFPSAEVAA